jgi:hypothetical protein
MIWNYSKTLYHAGAKALQIEFMIWKLYTYASFKLTRQIYIYIYICFFLFVKNKSIVCFFLYCSRCYCYWNSRVKTTSCFFFFFKNHIIKLNVINEIQNMCIILFKLSIFRKLSRHFRSFYFYFWMNRYFLKPHNFLYTTWKIKRFQFN